MKLKLEEERVCCKSFYNIFFSPHLLPPLSPSFFRSPFSLSLSLSLLSTYFLFLSPFSLKQVFPYLFFSHHFLVEIITKQSDEDEGCDGESKQKKSLKVRKRERERERVKKVRKRVLKRRKVDPEQSISQERKRRKGRERRKERERRRKRDNLIAQEVKVCLFERLLFLPFSSLFLSLFFLSPFFHPLSFHSLIQHHLILISSSKRETEERMG